MVNLPFRAIDDLGYRLGPGRRSLTAWVTTVAREDDKLRIELAVRGEGDERSDTRAAIVCGGVLRWVVTSTLRELALHDDHPALLPLTGEQGALSFSGTPDDPERAALEMLAAHDAVAGRYVAFEECANVSRYRTLASILAVGHGIAGRGPAAVLEAYATVLERRGVRTELIDRHPSHMWDPRHSTWIDLPPDVRLLDLGDGYVAARSFAVSGELPPLNSWDEDS